MDERKLHEEMVKKTGEIKEVASIFIGDVCVIIAPDKEYLGKCIKVMVELVRDRYKVRGFTSVEDARKWLETIRRR